MNLARLRAGYFFEPFVGVARMAVDVIRRPVQSEAKKNRHSLGSPERGGVLYGGAGGN